MPGQKRPATRSQTLARARSLRRPLTPAERRLWARLRAGRLAGLHFRRQCPIGPYVADFCCLQHGLVVELDGETHDEGRQRQDAARTAWLQGQGFRVVRFGNQEVHEDADAVARAVAIACGIDPEE